MHRNVRTAACILIAALGALGCDQAIQVDLRESQANRVLVALHDEGIGASKEREDARGDEARFRITVPRGEVPDALSVLRAADLPRSSEPGLNEVFGEASLVPTATEERARYVSALSGELARSLETIEGVLDARVHVAIPNRRDFSLDEQPPRPRASVLIKHRRGERPYDETSVQSLVAGAVEGMRTEDVAVVGVAGPEPPDLTTGGLVHLGPVAVSRGSAPILKGVLAAALALHALLAALVVVVARRRRARLDPAAQPSG
jgi:type III secretion protein J